MSTFSINIYTTNESSKIFLWEIKVDKSSNKIEQVLYLVRLLKRVEQVLHAWIYRQSQPQNEQKQKHSYRQQNTEKNDVILRFVNIFTDIEDSVPSFCMKYMHQLFQLITNVTAFS